MKRFWKTALALLLALALAVPAAAFGPPESDVFNAQLSDLARGIYEAMHHPEVLECLRSGGSYSLVFDGPFDSFTQGTDTIYEAHSYAFSAFELNHPEMFWLNGSSNRCEGNTEKITMTVTPNFQSNWTSGGRSTAADEAAADAVVQLLAQEARAQGGDYEQLLYVHDWLTTNNEYNTAAAAVGPNGAADGYLAWTPLAALTDVSQPVCEGYAKAFKLVCDALEIPCVIVDGQAEGGHEWNHVLLDGAWYAVDVTFDDPVGGGSGNVSGIEMHDYFLVGSDTQVKGYLTFSDTHTPDGSRIAGTSFGFPALSPIAYDPAAPHAPEEPDEPDEPEWPDPIEFSDVPEFSYYAPAVDWAVMIGVTNGMGKDPDDPLGRDYFAPNDTVTRGQAVTFLWRARGEPEPDTEENPFEDVSETDYFYKAVLWAVENNITNGMDATHFGPKLHVTRGQMITFLWRALGRPGETEDYEGKKWYSDAEYWGSELGILAGTDKAYSNQDDCPRCDVVYYLFRAILSADIAG